MNNKSWKSRRRSGGIRRKCMKEYIKLKDTLLEATTNAQTNQIGIANMTRHNLRQDRTEPADEEGSVHSNSVDIDVVQTSDNDSVSSENESNIDSIEFKNITFCSKLKEWAISKNISQVALKELMEIVNERIPGILPTDPRTLLRTPRNIALKVIEGGEYWHNGLTAPLKDVILRAFEEIPEIVYLNLNFDGLPIFKSTKKEFWPILCNLHGKPEIEPFIVGIYYGSGKPKNLNEYLEDFVTEIDHILKNGIQISKESITQTVNIRIRCFICDSPARAYIKGVCNFNAKHGCLKCTTIGEYSHQSHTVIFPITGCPKRTDLNFRAKRYGKHHKTDTPLLKLPIDMVEDFPISDSLHLIDLGVMKRLIIGWRDGNFGKLITKWRARDTQIVSDFLITCKMPSEFHRSVRGLDEIHFWKATEFRTFFYYLSVIILPHVLPQEAYEHFLTLFCAITICSCEHYKSLLDLSQELCIYFVNNFKNYYGDYMTSNIHNIVHITEEVRKFGTLDTFNSYPFENKLYIIKKMLRDGRKPLSQVAKRLNEGVECVAKTKDREAPYPRLFKIRQHHILDYGKFRISTKNNDKYFMTLEGTIVEAIEITQKYIKGHKIEDTLDIFDKPIKSSYLNMFKTSALKKCSQKIYVKISNVKLKLVSTIYNNEYYFIPLLHTLTP